MSLIRKHGIPILVTAPAPSGSMLAVPYFRQEQTNWCWAGCCEMVFHFYLLGNVRQCDMASWQFSALCCNSPSSSVCNRGAWPEPVYNHWGFTCTRVNSLMSLAAVKAEINAGRPVEPYYAWTGGGAHVAIIRGWYDNGDLEVSDPWYGAARMSYSYVVSAYGRGNWTITFNNIHR